MVCEDRNGSKWIKENSNQARMAAAKAKRKQRPGQWISTLLGAAWVPHGGGTGAFVCVWTICTDVKLLFGFWAVLLLFMTSLLCRGRQGRCMAVANEAPCSWLGYGVWSTPRTCFISSLWDVANPRTTKPFFQLHQKPSSKLCFQQFSNHCTVFAIWFTADFVRWNSCI